MNAIAERTQAISIVENWRNPRQVFSQQALIDRLWAFEKTPTEGIALSLSSSDLYDQILGELSAFRSSSDQGTLILGISPAYFLSALKAKGITNRRERSEAGLEPFSSTSP